MEGSRACEALRIEGGLDVDEVVVLGEVVRDDSPKLDWRSHASDFLVSEPSSSKISGRPRRATEALRFWRICSASDPETLRIAR